MRAYISKRADVAIKNKLNNMGCCVVEIDGGDRVYDAVSCHPDIFMCAKPDGSVFHGDITKIGHEYPKNIIFNAVCLDKYFIHNLSYTDETLLKTAEEMGLITINVKQGYTKCNTVIVDGKSVITSDRGIAKALSKISDIDVLEVSGGGVLLPGMDTGFLGGASGTTDNAVIFAGNITKHRDFEAIREFIESRGKKIIYFPDLPLTDIGSIIFEK